MILILLLFFDFLFFNFGFLDFLLTFFVNFDLLRLRVDLSFFFSFRCFFFDFSFRRDFNFFDSF